LLVEFDLADDDLVLEVLHVRAMLHVIVSLGELVTFDDIFLVVFQLHDSCVELFALFLQVGDLFLHLMLALLSNQGLFHSIRDATLVKVLKCLFVHSHLVTHSDQQVAPLSAVDGDLADNLIKALAEKLFTNSADARVASCLRLKSFLQVNSEVLYVGAGGWRTGDVTYPQLIVLDGLLGRQNFVEIILSTSLGVLVSRREQVGCLRSTTRVH